MELQVYNNTLIDEIKEKFSQYFPFLRMEFYQYQRQRQDQFKKEAYKGLYLQETSEFFKEGIIYFNQNTPVAELEQKFQVELGLVAKVFRKSGESWSDTSQTSHLTLGKQNDMGSTNFRAQFNLHTLFL